MMDLNERKRKILQAVIDEYIGTAEPVGSRAVAKREDLSLSSATIRNEMADLEDMGYLIQPHTSAGRVPSDEGYRFYVNSLMKKYRVGMEAIMELQKAFQMQLTRLDQIIKYAGNVASALTDYTTLISTPENESSKLRKIDLVPISAGKTMVIVVTEKVRSQVLNRELDEEECAVLAHTLTKGLAGMAVYRITPENMKPIIEELRGKVDIPDAVLAEILQFVFDTVTVHEDTEIYVSNMQSILKYPEYRDVQKAGKMFSFFENKDNLKRLIASDSGEGIRAKIGAENEDEILKDCSLVTVDYSLGGSRGGKISVIGPKRMNYAKVFASLDVISGEIDKILRYYTENE